MIIKRIKNEVKHQGIGGKEFIVDEKITETLTIQEVFEQACFGGNIACFNFINRRTDFDIMFEHKLYYGKVNGLGYVVAEDEFMEGE